MGRKPIIGLVGSIGAGKSEVARLLRSLGAAVIDSDKLAQAQLNDPVVMETLRGWWGERVFRSDGTINRAEIAAVVFGDAHELARLEGLLYPRIEAQRQAMLPSLTADPSVRAIVLDAPKLIEAGLAKQCDAIVCVDAAAAVRLQRLADTRGWSNDELHRREKLQIPLDEKKARADHIVSNNATIDCLRKEVERVFDSILRSYTP